MAKNITRNTGEAGDRTWNPWLESKALPTKPLALGAYGIITDVTYDNLPPFSNSVLDYQTEKKMDEPPPPYPGR